MAGFIPEVESLAVPRDPRNIPSRGIFWKYFRVYNIGNLVHLLVVVSLVLALLVLARAIVLQIIVLCVCAHTHIIRVFWAVGFLIFSSFRSFSSNPGSFQVRRSVQIC